MLGSSFRLEIKVHFSLKRAFFKQLAVKISQVGVFSLLSSCAILHHAQVSDIDDDKKFKRIAFDVKVNESGFSLDEALRLSKGVYFLKASSR